MQIVLGCTDGVTYYGDVHSEAEIMEQVEAANGYFGTTVQGSKIYVNTIEEVIERTSDFIELHNDWNVQTVTLLINGHERKFNARQIVWWEIRRDNHG